ncbi:MAG: sigma-E processing peptidase SpoIIGA [Clostridia bacterium]|nr:sigma-E processing peptidase SpoIIGA [Clostridia bacterium]
MTKNALFAIYNSRKGGIFIVVYVDILLALNFFVSFFLLQITALFSKRKPKLIKIIFSSLIGAVYSLIIFCDDISNVALAFSQLVASVIMVLAAFGFKRFYTFLKQLAVFYFGNFILLGVMMAACYALKLKFIAINNNVLYFDISSSTIIVCAALAYVAACIVIRLYNRTLSKKEVYFLTVENNGTSVDLLAFLDTGNKLREPFSNAPVIIVDSSKISADGKNTRLVPVSTVNGVGFLTAFKPDRIILKSAKGEEVIENAYIALSNDVKDENYSAILNYDILSI